MEPSIFELYDRRLEEIRELRALNEELLGALLEVLKDRRLYELAFTTINLAQLAVDKSKKLK